ncbi:MAG: FIST C-terminal domain-containing protein [Thermodesulfobacteriaceae bacterium]|nr:FIST C-terminal domain-containing protein [Thermodesulfobacteriaceae bacterium]MCX8041169.1 FIST C-terminal domain-containing protein [Thermodesulfobacteriaceae bacterium]MDW8135193.1 FIST N-terminal domain-containing protein [Thermodesulfobacterium sp.]
MKIFTFGWENFSEINPEVLLEIFKKGLRFDSNPDLILIFAPPKFLNLNLSEKLKREFPSTSVVGVSAYGVISNEKLFYNGITGLMLKFTKGGSLKVSYENNISNKVEEIKEKFKKIYLNPEYPSHLIWTSAPNSVINEVLDGLYELPSYPFSLWGGVASFSHPHGKARILYEDQIIEDGFLVLSFQKVQIYSSISLGFLPLGLSYKITKAKENKVYEIENVSAEKFLEKLFKGTTLKLEDLKNKEVVKDTLWAFPIVLLNREEGYVSVLRTFKNFNLKEGCMEFYGNLRVGDRIKFCIGDPKLILEDVKKRFNKFRGEVNKNSLEVLIYVSCVARNYIMAKEGHSYEEFSLCKSLFPEQEIVGFLSFGEIGHDKRNRPGMFYNETSILIGLKEDG